MNSGEKRPVGEAFERLWGQALLAVSTAEEEASRVASRFSVAAGWSQDEVKRQARVFTERLTQQRTLMERSLDDGVKKTLSRLKVPRRDEVSQLASRLAKVEGRLDALLSKRG